MPRSKKSYKPKSKAKRTQRSKRRQVSSMPRQIQNATYMPKSRLVRFSGFRSYIVKDTAGTTGAYPPILEIAANNPRKFIHTTQGTWDSNSLGAKGVSVAGLAQWITNSVPGASATGSYLTAHTLSALVTITAVPLPGAGGEDQSQDTIKLCVQNNTRGGNMMNKTISGTFNSEIVSQTVGMKTAMLYTNPGGTPRGATIVQGYSFKKQNAAPGSMAYNRFYADKDPDEKDFINVGFLPGDSVGYGLTGTRLPDLRVEVKVSYIVMLTEPNTAIQNSELNAGIDLPSIPQVISSITDFTPISD